MYPISGEGYSNAGVRFLRVKNLVKFEQVEKMCTMV